MHICKMCLSPTRSPACFSRCRDHHQGNLQEHYGSKQTFKVYNEPLSFYEECLKLNIQLLNGSFIYL